MSNLIKLSEVKSLATFDFDQITDADQRESAERICTKYDAIYADLKQQASEILKTNTVELGKTVYALKHALDHGNFTNVCQGKYGIDKKKQAALVQVGEAITNGQLTDDALAMLAATEPRAAQQFLKADEETKSSYVDAFKDTGKAPSQRSFTPQQREYLDRRQQQDRMAQNVERNLAEAFTDSPASPWFKATEETVDTEVTSVSSIETDDGPSLTIFNEPKPTSNPDFGKPRYQMLCEVVDKLKLIQNMPSDDSKYFDNACKVASNICLEMCGERSLSRR